MEFEQCLEASLLKVKGLIGRGGFAAVYKALYNGGAGRPHALGHATHWPFAR